MLQLHNVLSILHQTSRIVIKSVVNDLCSNVHINLSGLSIEIICSTSLAILDIKVVSFQHSYCRGSRYFEKMRVKTY